MNSSPSASTSSNLILQQLGLRAQPQPALSQPSEFDDFPLLTASSELIEEIRKRMGIAFGDVTASEQKIQQLLRMAYHFVESGAFNPERKNQVSEKRGGGKS